MAAMLACVNPLGKFSKQYKCQIAGKPEPKTAYDYIERGVDHSRAGDNNCALGACSEAIRLDSRNGAAYACRSNVLNQLNKLADALTDINQAIKLEPDNGDFYMSRSVILQRQDKLDEAAGDLTVATKLISSQFGRSVAYSSRAGIYRKKGKLDEALQDYSEAIRLAPDFAFHHNHRGEVYFEKGNFEQALSDFTAAIQLDPKNQYFYTDRARTYRKLGRDELASSDEQRAKMAESGNTSGPVPTPESTTSKAPPIVSGGELTAKATSLPPPPYPPVARAAHATGTVVVQVLVDETGNVVSARAVSGHPLLQAAAVVAARNAKFAPSKILGRPVKVNGTLTYRFDGT